MNDVAHGPPPELHDAHVRAWREHNAVVVCGSPAEADLLAQRSYNAVDGATIRDNEHWQQYRNRLVIVTPTGKTAARGAAATLLSFGCDVQALTNGADLQAEDLFELPRQPLFDDLVTETSGEPSSYWPPPLDLAKLATRAPQPPRFVLADWLPVGYATLLAGHGGVGKSAIGLHLAVCVAMGLPFFGLATERRRVLYVSCEDREGVLHWRLAHICAYLGLDMAALHEWLDTRDLVGHDAVLWERDPRTGYTVTPAYDGFCAIVERTRPGLAAIDGVSDTFGGNENARTEVKRYINALLKPLGPDGALLALGHVAKPTAANAETSEGYSGSTQWHNAVRARWYLYPETERDEDDARRKRTGKLSLELQKSNLGRTDQAMTFEWDNEARLFVATATAGSRLDREQRDRGEQAGVMGAFISCVRANITVPAAMQGPRTAFHVLSQRPEFPGSLRANRRRFWSHIETLRQLGQITEDEYRRNDRHHASKFVPTTEGRGLCGQ